MYYCENCDTYIEDDQVMDGSNGLLMCPNCHTEELVDATECRICHKPVVDEYLCDDCRSIIVEDIRDLIDILDEEQTGQPNLDRYDLACLIAEVLEDEYL